jgi:aryl-alcohol dehydrogenase-like predicted oxidoreductase
LWRSLEESLRLLDRDCIDILFVHEPDRPGQYDWFEDWRPVRGEVCEVLAEARHRGLIRYTGLGGTTAYELAWLCRNGEFDVLLTAFNYSLLWREAEVTLIPAAKEKGMGIVAGSPLQQGWLARRFDRRVREDPPPWLSPPRREQFVRLYDLCESLQMPLPELALRFVLSNPDVDTVLTGARSREEMEQNICAAEAGPLPDDVLEELGRIAAMVPFRPRGEPSWPALGSEQYRGPGTLH